MKILDELADLKRSLIVSQRNRVNGKTGKLFDHRDQRLKILLDRDVESVSVLEIDGNCRLLVMVL
jgi:hypothetical protein